MPVSNRYDEQRGQTGNSTAIGEPLDGQAECRHVMELTFAFAQSQVLFAAVELDLFTILEKKSLRADEVSRALGLHERGSREFLDALVALGLLTTNAGRYSNSATATRYLVKGGSTYVGGFVDFVAARLYPVWGRLLDAIRTGLPQNEARTESDYYANLGSDHARHARFLKGMTGLSARPAEVIARMFPWQRYETFIDVGGATGSLAMHIIERHPHLMGGVFDLPAVRPFFEQETSEARDRLMFHEGDFFKDRLPAADVFIMGHVLHNWNVAEKQQLAAAAQRDLNPGGALVVYEWLLDENRRNVLPLMDSLTMLLVTQHGCGMTSDTCRRLLLDAGFARVETLAVDDPFLIVVAWKG